MKVLVDCQSLQTSSAFRGIGRYVMNLVKGLAASDQVESLKVLVNCSLDNVSQVIKILSPVVKEEDFVRFCPTAPEKLLYPDVNFVEYSANELLYVDAVLATGADVLLVGSMLEGDGEPFVFPPYNYLKGRIKIATVIHDFIPYYDYVKFLFSKNLQLRYRYYLSLVAYSDIFLCNSAFTQSECRNLFPGVKSKAIFAGTDMYLKEGEAFDLPQTEKFQYAEKGKYILYAGGSDDRKNIGTLINSYAKLDESLKKEHPLIVVCGKNKLFTDRYSKQYEKVLGLSSKGRVLGYVSDDELKALYANCYLFAFPSFSEGFGLTILEAMCCGAPCICSNTTSMPEVLGYDEATFSPHSEEELSSLMKKCSTDSVFMDKLRNHCKKQKDAFSWKVTADLAVEALLELGAFETRYSEEELLSTLSLQHHKGSLRMQLANSIYRQRYQTLYLNVTSNKEKESALKAIQDHQKYRSFDVVEVEKKENEFVLLGEKTKIEPMVGDVFLTTEVTEKTELLLKWEKEGCQILKFENGSIENL